MRVLEPGDPVTVSVGRYRHCPGKVKEFVGEDLILVDVMVPATLAVRRSEIHPWRSKA